MLSQLLRSKDPQERQVGQAITQLEYENLMTALKLALSAQVSITGPYDALIVYLNERKDHRRKLTLFQFMIERMEAYSSELLAGPLGFELAGIINALGTVYLDLRQYTEAATAYQKTVQVLLQVADIDEQARDVLKARTYNGLGRVAEEQRQWPQAEQYYQQALQLYIESNARYEQAGTYHQLGMVAQAQRQWPQAKGYYLQALEVFVGDEDTDSSNIVLRSLARLWQDSSDQDLPATIASILVQLWRKQRHGYARC